MARLLLLVAIIFGLWYWWTSAKKLPKEQQRKFYWRSAFWAVLAISIALVAAGRMHWLGAGIAALVPIAKGLLAGGIRLLPFLQFWGKMKTGPSRFQTRSLKIEINFANGQMDGEVLQGEFAGQRLSQLSQTQLKQVSEWLKGVDRESFVLLQAYSLRKGYSTHSDHQQTSSDSFSGVSEEEAWQILGLNPGSSEEEIVKAHKKLIQKLHPDRGGNDYLAAKINSARDRLIS